MSMFKSLNHKLLAAMFILGGVDAFLHPEPRAAKAANAGVPSAHSAAVLNAALMVIGGTLLALDIAPRLAALLLAGTLIPTTYVGHPFWQEEDTANRKNQRTQFLKNLAMIGGLLEVVFE
jgi:putative oxidoreductase